MMKKFFVMAFAAMMSVCAFAADDIKFQWYGMSEETTNKVLNSTDKWTNLKPAAAFQLAAQKDPTLYKDYNKFVAKWNELVAKYPVDNNDFRFVQLVTWSGDKFSDEIIQKVYFDNVGRTDYVGNYIREYFALYHYKKLLKVTTADKIVAEVFKNVNLKNAKQVFNLLQKCQFDLNDEVLKGYLKKLNRIVYPHIGESDEYKQLAVSIQLMLKSLE